MARIHTSEDGPFIGGLSININLAIRTLAIHRSSDVWLPRYPPMGADVGIFKDADALTYGYVYTLPNKL